MTDLSEKEYISWNDLYNDSHIRESLMEYYYILEKKNIDSVLKRQFEYIIKHFFQKEDSQVVLKVHLDDYFNYKTIPQVLLIESIQYFVLFLCCKELAILNGYEININDTNIFNKKTDVIQYEKISEYPFYKILQEYTNEYLSHTMLNFKIDVSGNNDNQTVVNKEKQEVFIKSLNPIKTFKNHKKEIEEFLKVKENKRISSYTISEYFKKFMSLIHQRISELIHERVLYIVNAIVPQINLKNTYYFAAGEGGPTKSLFGVSNLGVVLFQYSLDVKQKPIVSPSFELPVSKRDYIHITTLGYENETDISTFTFSFDNRNKKLKFTACHNQYKINNKSNKIAGLCHFESDESNLNTFNTIIMNTNKADNGLKASFSINPYRKGNEYEECMFVISVTNPEPRSKEDITLTISKSDSFDNDKFEVEKDKIDGLFRDKIEQKKLLYLIDLLKEADETNQWSFNTPSLCGKFVGTENKYAGFGEPKITADLRYIPTNETIENKSDETDISQETAYRDLRYSYFKLTTNVEEKKIDIEIESFVSPLISRLDKAYELLDYRATQDSLPPDFELPAESKIPTSCINELTLQNYKVEGVNWHADNPQMSPKIEIPSYNQALAMLRSFGLLEAFVIRIRTVMEENMSAYSQEEYERVISKLRNLLVYQAVSYDKTAEARGIDTKYQLSENQCVTYGLYQSLKWYCYPLQKKDASPYQYDYERYYRFEW